MNTTPTIYGYARMRQKDCQESCGLDHEDCQESCRLHREAQIERVRKEIDALRARSEFANYRDGGVLSEPEAVSPQWVDFLDRQAAQELWGVLKPGDMLVVNGIDRCFNGLLDFDNLRKACQQRGIALKCCTTGADSTTAVGTLILEAIDSMADWKRETIRDRTREALAAARRLGKKTGGKSPVGYRGVEVPGTPGQRGRQAGRQTVTLLAPDFEQIEVIRRIVQFRDSGKSWGQVSDAVERWLVERDGRRWKPEWDRRWKWQRCQRGYNNWHNGLRQMVEPEERPRADQDANGVA